MNNPDLGPALVRTLVPIIIGPVLARFVPGLDPRDPEVLLIASAAISYVYYVIVRLAEDKFPRLGWLLGLAKAPMYSREPAPSPGPGESAEVVVTPEVDPDYVYDPTADVTPESEPEPYIEPVPEPVPGVDYEPEPYTPEHPRPTSEYEYVPASERLPAAARPAPKKTTIRKVAVKRQPVKRQPPKPRQ